MNQNGQGFDVFRLLIAAVLALAILVIIITIISFIDNWKYEVSQHQLYDGLKSAVETPNGEIVVKKNITLRPSSVFTSASLAANAKISPSSCVEIDVGNRSAFELTGNTFLKVQAAQIITVYYQCKNNPAEKPDCRPYCLVSFSKEIRAT